jgi:hypothetical protein
MYQDQYGQTECKPCPAGYYSSKSKDRLVKGKILEIEAKWTPLTQIYMTTQFTGFVLVVTHGNFNKSGRAKLVLLTQTRLEIPTPCLGV